MCLLSLRPPGGLHFARCFVPTERKPGSTYTVTPAVVEQRRAAATRHGIRSEVVVRDSARLQKRRLLRKLGRKAGDLDVTSAVLVDLLARALAKLSLLDQHYARTGIVREDDSAAPTLHLYFTALNSARLCAGRLADHLERLGDASGETLESYVEANYTRSGNGDGADG